jgi:hypothetical protein
LATSSSSGRKDRQTAKRTPTLTTFGQPELDLRSGFYDLGISQDGRRHSVPIRRPKCNLQTRNEWKARPHTHHPKGEDGSSDGSIASRYKQIENIPRRNEFT